MIIYPTNLPCPNLAGNVMQGGRTFLRSTFDYAIRQRKTYCGDYNLAVMFTTKDANQMKDFRDFYYTTLDNGANSFMADWEIEGDRTLKEFRFSSTYSASSLGKSIYRIKATFEMITKIKDL